MRTKFGKLMKSKSGDGTTEHTERDQWILNKFDFLHMHKVQLRGRQAGGLKARSAAWVACESHPQ